MCAEGFLDEGAEEGEMCGNGFMVRRWGGGVERAGLEFRSDGGKSVWDSQERKECTVAVWYRVCVDSGNHY